jgi:hypothetical protein
MGLLCTNTSAEGMSREDVASGEAVEPKGDTIRLKVVLPGS